MDEWITLDKEDDANDDAHNWQSRDFAQSSEIDHTAELIAHAAQEYESVESLDVKEKERSVEIAREILEKLRVQIGDVDLAHGLFGLPTPLDQLIRGLHDALDIFDHFISMARAMDGDFVHDAHVRGAIVASNALSYQMVRGAHDNAASKSNQAEMERLQTHMDAFSEEAKQETGKTFSDLINKMEMGIQKAQARIEAMGTRDTFGQSARGKADHMAIGAHSSQKKKDVRLQSANFNDDYSKQLAARKQARLAVVRNLQAQRATQRNQLNQKMSAHQGKEAQQAPKQGAMDQLLSPQQIEQMRNAMATTLGAAPVEVGVKDTMKQIMNQKVQSRMVKQTVEQSKRGLHNRQDIQETQVTQKEPPRPNKRNQLGL